MPVKNTTARDLVGFGLTLLALLVAACDRPPPRRPNIVLITLDTTRADRLGCYGYERPTSPKLDAFASESIVYTRAISPSSWTLPAHASLFTGKFTSSHGARYDPEGPLRLTAGIEGPEAWAMFSEKLIAQDGHG
jgi:hypothetical protein